MQPQIILTDIPSQLCSVSPTIICTGLYNKQEAYFKFFYKKGNKIKRNSDMAIEYEAKVYEYITNELNKYKELELNKYFVRWLGTVEYSQLAISNFFSNNAAKIKFNSLSIDRQYTIGTTLGCLVTENIANSQTLASFLNRELASREYLIDILFLYLNSVIIMYDKLNIVHNDLHTNNVLIVKKDCNYNILNPHTTQYEPYRSKIELLIIDYDTSYVRNMTNPQLEQDKGPCEKYGSCNRKSKKDFYTIFAVLVSIKYKHRHLADIIDEFLELFMPNRRTRDLLETHITRAIKKEIKYHWSSYCNFNEQQNNFCDNCGNTAETDDTMVFLDDMYIAFYNKYIL